MNDLPALDDDAQRLLSALRAEEELPPALQAAVWERLEAPPAAAAPAPRPAYVWWGVAAAAAIVLAFVGLSSTTARDADNDGGDNQAMYGADTGPASGQARPGEPEASSPTKTRPSPAGTRTAPSAEGLDPEPGPDAEDDAETLAPEAEPLLAPPDVRPDDRSAPAKIPSRPRVPTKRPTPTADDDVAPEPSHETITLAGEIALLKKMRAALNADDAARVLQLAAEHAAAYPKGALAPERGGLEVIAKCKAGRAGATKAAAAFVRAHPGAPLVDRVRTACPEVEKSPTP